MDKERAGIQSVEVGFTLLEALTRARGPQMLKDLASDAGMSAAKAHRYLVSFQRIGLVTQDARTSRYDLGPASLKLGLASLARLDPVRLARERMPALMERIHHTAAIAVWGNTGRPSCTGRKARRRAPPTCAWAMSCPSWPRPPGACSQPGCPARARPR